ncbi:hypothetical protein BJ508DRAFT_410417 [Ascobolus immersus RN42]|uniref:Uncharacterized protein n=1 Tax=Ascobolus immersus RN42 TaxID=1160509 RepID=A0A3N4INE8_ASCIM|nr:hypothetical protein BJ508DRAFT_410417 [Ascobolus immersus RN42]
MNPDDTILYSDFRSPTLPTLRSHASKAKYHLRFTHGHNTLPATPSARASARIEHLLREDKKLPYGSGVPKQHWKIPSSQHISHYRIRGATLRKFPEGQERRRFLYEARWANHQLSRCRCSDYCFLRYCGGVNGRKMEMRCEMRGEYEAWLREEWELDGVDWYKEEVGGRREGEEGVPEPSWEGLVEKAAISGKSKRKCRGVGGMLMATANDQAGDMLDCTAGDAKEWELVECSFLSDAESWEEDFDTKSIPCWSV